MRSTVAFVGVVAFLPVVGYADPPKCEPERAVLKIDYAPLSGPNPRIPPRGSVVLGFTISPIGKAENVAIIRSTTNWPKGNDRAVKAVESAEFSPPKAPCAQTMRFVVSTDG